MSEILLVRLMTVRGHRLTFPALKSITQLLVYPFLFIEQQTAYNKNIQKKNRTLLLYLILMNDLSTVLHAHLD